MSNLIYTTLKIYWPGFHGLTPFQLACYNGHFEIVDLLINRSSDLNIDLNVKDKSMGRTGFQYACMFNYPNIVQKLIQKSTMFNIDLNAKGNENDETALHIACFKRHSSIGKAM